MTVTKRDRRASHTLCAWCGREIPRAGLRYGTPLEPVLLWDGTKLPLTTAVCGPYCPRRPAAAPVVTTTPVWLRPREQTA